MPGIEIKGRSKIANYRHGGRTKKFGGGRTNLLEQLGRVEAEPSNRNRRAEISRVHSELNRGYAKGGRAGYAIGSVAKVAKIAARKLRKPKPHRDKPPSKTHGKDVPTMAAEGGRAGHFAGSLVKNIPKLLKKLGTEIKDAPLPPQLQKTLDEVKKLQKLQKPGVKKAAGGRIGFREGTPKALEKAATQKKIKQTKAVKRLTTSDKAYSPKKLIVEAFKRNERGGGTGTAEAITDWHNIREEAKKVQKRLPGSTVTVRPQEERVHRRGLGQKVASRQILQPSQATIERTRFKKGTDKKWIQKAVDPKHKGYCTPMTKKTCTPARKALARTFKKKAKTGW